MTAADNKTGGGKEERSGAETKRRQMAQTEIRESTEMAFEVYGEQLKTVPSFKYLGKILTAGDNDWTAVVGNLGKARRAGDDCSG